MNLVERSYQVFAKYAIDSIKNACTTCCLLEDEVDQLVKGNVNEISWDLLRLYNDAAQEPELDINEFKHFLPRYLEFISDFSFPSHSVELSLRNMASYEVSQWEPEEWELINLFVEDFFKRCLQLRPIPKDSGDLVSILIMIDNAGISMSKFLNIWLEDDSLIGSIYFNDLIAYDFEWLSRTTVQNLFASEAQSATIYNWATSSEVRKKFAQEIEGFVLNDDLKIEENIITEFNWLYEFITNPSLSPSP